MILIQFFFVFLYLETLNLLAIFGYENSVKDLALFIYDKTFSVNREIKLKIMLYHNFLHHHRCIVFCFGSLSDH